MSDVGKQRTPLSVLIWAVGMFVTIGMMSLGYLVVMVHALELRVERVEANRFTAHDGQKVYQVLAEIRTEVAKLPQQVPPAWFMNHVNKIEGRVVKLEDKCKKWK